MDDAEIVSLPYGNSVWHRLKVRSPLRKCGKYLFQSPAKKKKIEQLTKNSVMLTLLGTNIPDTFENKIMH